ncbi:uncharacterized protein LOC120286550 [Eucalyptus grandis]|uniref:uncharacterized protein LOC120286550 n=1 Tax=Eucalyptus grandis TaxID=71139 RepID=UPI00192EBDF5|nr:uncharacterized protein LOC120286550 [Eucalyptus grandis]
MVLQRKRCQESFLERNGEANHGTHRLRDVTLETKPRSLGGGSVRTDVQRRLIWDHCICKAIGKCHTPYLKNSLKKHMFEIESNRDNMLDELYELYTEFMTSLKDDNIIKGNVRALKYISSLFPDDASCEDAMVRKMVVPLHCSLNMLEEDTGLAQGLA